MNSNGIDVQRVFGELMGADEELIVTVQQDPTKIPLHILLPAGKKTQEMYGRNVDKWKKTEEMYFKALCGPSCDHFEEGEFRVQFREHQKNKTHERKRMRPRLSPEYKAHLKSAAHILMVRIKIHEANGECWGCGEPAIECHHKRYRPETWGTAEEMDDMLAVCRMCHNVLDTRRNKEMDKKRKAAAEAQS